MKKNRLFFAPVLLALFCTCASMGGGAGPEGTEGIPLHDAIEESAAKIAAGLPGKTRVAIVAFDSEYENLSNYIMDELTGALTDGSLEVADRRNLAFVYKELGFQMSGDVSDESAVSIGKFLGAQYVVTGQMVKAGSRYRYRLSGINVETAVQESSARLDVRDSRDLRSLLADMRNNKTAAVAAGYGTEQAGAVPTTAGAFLDRGILFATRGDFDMAIEEFTGAIQLDDKLASAYLLRGRALAASVLHIINIGESFSDIKTTSTGGTALTAKQKAAFDRAMADFTQAVKLDPKNAAAYYERGRIYSDQSDTDRAIADYNQAIRLNPNYALAYNRRGMAYNDKKDYDRAMADYTQAIRIDPNYAMPYNNRGVAYNDKKDYDLAIADYTQAIRIDPNYAMPYYNRGNVYYMKKDYNRAIADYSQAIRVDPNYALAKEWLENARKARGR